jgi:isopenicillin-N epimerase
MHNLEKPGGSDWANLWDLDPEVVFLNHGSFGACPRAILDVQQQYRAQMEAEPVRFFVRELPGLLDEARTAVAEFVGATPSCVALVPNATSGVNSVLRSHHFEPDDEILIFDHVYNAVRNVAHFVTERSGAHVRTVPIPFPIDDPALVVERVLNAVTSRTVLAVLDHITSPTGLVMPMEALVRELRERGVETLVDGAHCPGQLDLNLDQLGAAYYVGNCHKWMCTAKGSALLYVRSDLQNKVRPSAISHGANMPTGKHSRYRMEFDWTGTLDPTAYLTIPHAIQFFEERVPGGWSGLRRMNRQLALETRSLLANRLGVEVPAPESMIAFLSAVELPDGEAKQPDSPLYTDPLQDTLLHRYGVEVPIVPWPAPPNRLIRTSSQLYNTLAQGEFLASALQEALNG